MKFCPSAAHDRPATKWRGFHFWPNHVTRLESSSILPSSARVVKTGKLKARETRLFKEHARMRTNEESSLKRGRLSKTNATLARTPALFLFTEQCKLVREREREKRSGCEWIQWQGKAGEGSLTPMLHSRFAHSEALHCLICLNCLQYN